MRRPKKAIAQEKGIDPVEIWFADEARIGQKNKVTRRWARQALGTGRSTYGLDLYLWRHLPKRRQGRGARFARLQH